MPSPHTLAENNTTFEQVFAYLIAWAGGWGFQVYDGPYPVVLLIDDLKTQNAILESQLAASQVQVSTLNIQMADVLLRLNALDGGG